MLLLAGVACQKMYVSEGESSVIKQDQDKVRLKALLADRDTRWTVDELAIPAEISGVFQITNDKELAFLLEFGCLEGGKYKLVNNIDVAASALSEKFSSEIGVEKFVDFEFDGCGNTVSGLNLPVAAGLFSEVSGTSKVRNLILSGCTVGNVENVSNVLGTGALIGSAKGSLEVSEVTVLSSSVMAPCKVGGLIGSFADGTARFTGCKVSGSTIQTLHFKGISGWCGGFIGFVGRSEEKNAALSVTVETEDCSVTGCAVKAGMESATRYSGKFLGTIVGYDKKEVFMMNGCTVSDDTTLSVTDAKGAAYKSEDPSGIIGGHKYLNGVIYIDGIVYVTPWDGATKTEPALDGDTYLVYTADELAWFQGKTVTNKIHILRDINLGGQLFDPIYKAQYIDGQKPDGENACISGLKVVRTNCGKEDGGAFIRQACGTTVHKNITFRKADIKATHDESADHGNAYCATLCGNMDGTYTMENVHAYDGKLYGVNKMGGLLGRVYATATIKDCSVSGYYIENYQVDKPEDFGNSLISVIFYPQGEIGGMIGFIHHDATVSNCHVYNTEINAYGQDDKNMLLITVPGRHVGTVIGDIRVGNSSTAFNIVINDTSSDTETVNLTKQHRLDQHSGATFVGKCYYAQTSDKKGTVTVDGKSITIK